MSDDSEKVSLSDDLYGFARQLALLSPSPHARSRDQLLFEAGRQSALSPMVGLWKVTAGAFGFLSVVLGIFLMSPSQPRVVERTREVVRYLPQEVEPEQPQANPPAISPRNYVSQPVANDAAETLRLLHLRNEMLRWGAEMLPPEKAPLAASEQPKPEKKPLDEFRLPGGTFALPPRLPWRPANEKE